MMLYLSSAPLTPVLRNVIPKYIIQMEGCNPLWIINTEDHIILNLLPVYSYGCILPLIP